MKPHTSELLVRIGRKIFMEGTPLEQRNAMGMAFAAMVEKRFGQPEPAGPGETTAVAFDTPKTAALVFDRVWSPPIFHKRPPAEIRVYGATEAEILMQLVMLTFKDHPKVISAMVEALTELRDSSSAPQIEVGFTPSRLIAQALSIELGTPATPIYRSHENLEKEYKPGPHTVIYAALRRLQIVREDELTWDQVLEFRRDGDARQAYRRLVHWIDASMLGSDMNFIADEISVRHEAYEWAIRKHGLKTLVGAVETVLDPRFLGGVSLTAASTALLTTPTAALVTGGGLAIGKLALSVAKGFLDLHDARRGSHSEVAFIHHLRKRLRSARRGDPVC